MSTTLQLLQAYPLGTLEVEVHNITIEGVKPKGIVTSLQATNSGSGLAVVGGTVYSVKNLLPYLRSFDQLTTPLSDGTVPVIALANIVLHPFEGWQVTSVNERVLKVGHPNLCEMVVRHMSDGEWAIDVWSGTVHQQPGNMCAAYDYLRSLHFALPLAGQPLKEGIDYMRKN